MPIFPLGIQINFLVGYAIARCLYTTPYPVNRAGMCYFSCIFKYANSFSFSLGLFNQIVQVLLQINVKMSIKYLALGSEPNTS